MWGFRLFLRILQTVISQERVAVEGSNSGNGVPVGVCTCDKNLARIGSGGSAMQQKEQSSEKHWVNALMFSGEFKTTDPIRDILLVYAWVDAMCTKEQSDIM